MHGAYLERVAVLRGAKVEGGSSRWLDLRRDIPMMERTIAEHEIGMVVIYSLSSYLPQSDRSSEGKIRDALQPLLGLMERSCGGRSVSLFPVGLSRS